MPRPSLLEGDWDALPDPDSPEASTSSALATLAPIPKVLSVRERAEDEFLPDASGLLSPVGEGDETCFAGDSEASSPGRCSASRSFSPIGIERQNSGKLLHTGEVLDLPQVSTLLQSKGPVVSELEEQKLPLRPASGPARELAQSPTKSVAAVVAGEDVQPEEAEPEEMVCLDGQPGSPSSPSLHKAELATAQEQLELLGKEVTAPVLLVSDIIGADAGSEDPSPCGVDASTRAAVSAGLPDRSLSFVEPWQSTEEGLGGFARAESFVEALPQSDSDRREGLGGFARAESFVEPLPQSDSDRREAMRAALSAANRAVSFVDCGDDDGRLEAMRLACSAFAASPVGDADRQQDQPAKAVGSLESMPDSEADRREAMKKAVSFIESAPDADAERIEASNANALSIEFQLPDESRQLATFVQRPLGLDLTKSHPVGVERTGGHAEELGVRPGWLLACINGEDVQHKDFDYICSLLAKLVPQLLDGEKAMKKAVNFVEIEPDADAERVEAMHKALSFVESMPGSPSNLVSANSFVESLSPQSPKDRREAMGMACAAAGRSETFVETSSQPEADRRVAMKLAFCPPERCDTFIEVSQADSARCEAMRLACATADEPDSPGELSPQPLLRERATTFVEVSQPEAGSIDVARPVCASTDELEGHPGTLLRGGPQEHCEAIQMLAPVPNIQAVTAVEMQASPPIAAQQALAAVQPLSPPQPQHSAQPAPPQQQLAAAPQQFAPAQQQVPGSTLTDPGHYPGICAGQLVPVQAGSGLCVSQIAPVSQASFGAPDSQIVAQATGSEIVAAAKQASFGALDGQIMPSQQASFGALENQIVPAHQGGPLVMAVIPAAQVPVSEVVPCWQGMPVMEPGEDLGQAYLRYCNAHFSHMQRHGYPLAEAHYNMARVLSLGVHAGPIIGLPPCIDDATEEQIVEGRLDLALEQLRSAVVANFVDAARAENDEDLQALREARPRQFSDLVRRMRGLPTAEECGEALAIREAVDECNGIVALRQEASDRVDISVGMRVEICGLMKRSDLNGQKGNVAKWYAEKAAWVVRLDDGTSKKLRALNLKPCLQDSEASDGSSSGSDSESEADGSEGDEGRGRQRRHRGRARPEEDDEEEEEDKSFSTWLGMGKKKKKKKTKEEEPPVQEDASSGSGGDGEEKGKEDQDGENKEAAESNGSSSSGEEEDDEAGAFSWMASRKVAMEESMKDMKESWRQAFGWNW